MSRKAPSLWIEQRGHQYRVYWRNGVPGLRARPYLPFYVRAEAERFIVMAGLLGLDTARQVATTEDPQAAAALLQAALTERGLAPADPAPEPLPPAPAGPPPLFTAPADPRLTGVTFEELWTRFRTVARFDTAVPLESRTAGPVLTPAAPSRPGTLEPPSPS
jgi:hypothetical protein